MTVWDVEGIPNPATGLRTSSGNQAVVTGVEARGATDLVLRIYEAAHQRG